MVKEYTQLSGSIVYMFFRSVIAWVAIWTTALSYGKDLLLSGFQRNLFNNLMKSNSYRWKGAEVNCRCCYFQTLSVVHCMNATASAQSPNNICQLLRVTRKRSGTSAGNAQVQFHFRDNQQRAFGISNISNYIYVPNITGFIISSKNFSVPFLFSEQNITKILKFHKNTRNLWYVFLTFKYMEYLY